MDACVRIFYVTMLKEILVVVHASLVIVYLFTCWLFFCQFPIELESNSDILRFSSTN